MKKVLLPLLLLLIGYIGHAQSSFGFKGGVNLGKFTGPGVIAGASTLTAGNIGVYDNIAFASTTSLQIELSVSWEGEKYNNPINYGSFKFAYLNLPVLIHQKIAAGLFAETGPQVGLLLGATNTNDGTTSDYSSQVTSISFDWDFGIGYKFSRMLALDARYNLGISNLGSSIATDRDYRNGFFSFNIFFSPFGRHHNSH